jgi:hypothetical protein
MVNRVTQQERDALVAAAADYVRFEDGYHVLDEEAIVALQRRYGVSYERARGAISAAARRIQAAHVRARYEEEGE